MSQPPPEGPPKPAEKYPTVMPGTSVVNMSDGTHPDAVEQEYNLGDGSTPNPSKLGTHVRPKTSAPDPTD